MTAASEAIEIDGRRYAWRSLGAGPPLVMVNGYAATSTDWSPAFLAALAESFELICPDNRGVGESEPGREELTIAAMAADVEALLDALGVETAAVCGWSMGGYVAQAVAERAPARVTGLALIGTHPGGPAYVSTGDAEAFARLTDYSGTPREQAARLISVFFPPDHIDSAEAELGETYAAARARLDPATLDAQVKALVAWRDREPPPLGATPPALVIHGALDRLVAVANAAPLAERWNARLEIFDQSAHAAMTQEPERAAAAIGEALAPG
ncbi:MAG: alpha/beta fold hydrolase [Solirubrobacterales bacterium]